MCFLEVREVFTLFWGKSGQHKSSAESLGWAGQICTGVLLPPFAKSLAVDKPQKWTLAVSKKGIPDANIRGSGGESSEKGPERKAALMAQEQPETQSCPLTRKAPAGTLLPLQPHFPASGDHVLQCMRVQEHRPHAGASDQLSLDKVATAFAGSWKGQNLPLGLSGVHGGAPFLQAHGHTREVPPTDRGCGSWTAKTSLYRPCPEIPEPF